MHNQKEGVKTLISIFGDCSLTCSRVFYQSIFNALKNKKRTLLLNFGTNNAYNRLTSIDYTLNNNEQIINSAQFMEVEIYEQDNFKSIELINKLHDNFDIVFIKEPDNINYYEFLDELKKLTSLYNLDIVVLIQQNNNNNLNMEELKKHNDITYLIIDNKEVFDLFKIEFHYFDKDIIDSADYRQVGYIYSAVIGAKETILPSKEKVSPQNISPSYRSRRKKRKLSAIERSFYLKENIKNVIILEELYSKIKGFDYTIITFDLYKYDNLFEISAFEIKNSFNLLAEYVKKYIRESKVFGNLESQISLQDEWIIKIKVTNSREVHGAGKELIQNQIVLISTILAIYKLQRVKYKVKSKKPIIIDVIRNRLNVSQKIKFDRYIKTLKLKHIKSVVSYELHFNTPNREYIKHDDGEEWI